MHYAEMSLGRLQEEYDQSLARYQAYQGMGLSLNISRGKPGAEELSHSNGLLTCLSETDYTAEDGTDCRNYGGLDGLPEMKRLLAQLLDVAPEEVIVGGNASLSLMFNCLSDLAALKKDRPLKFICPAPGYDRHFFMCQFFGIEMLTVSMSPTGPDMDRVEELAKDPDTVGMWCVPVFSNPQGYTYSDDTIRRLAAMPTAHPGFRLFWDNAYTVHHFRGARPQPLSIMDACREYGNPDRPLLFTSFSKISFGGAGVCGVAASAPNRAAILKRLAVQTVGPDKINQLRHVRFYKDLNGVLAHMGALAKIIRVKFDCADAVFSRCIADTGAGEWTRPDGGYFLTFDTLPGCAKRTVALCKDAGLILTDAGAVFPYGKDPQDRCLRVCPTFVSVEELELALQIFCEAVKLVALEKFLNNGN